MGSPDAVVESASCPVVDYLNVAQALGDVEVVQDAGCLFCGDVVPFLHRNDLVSGQLQIFACPGVTLRGRVRRQGLQVLLATRPAPLPRI